LPPASARIFGYVDGKRSLAEIEAKATQEGMLAAHENIRIVVEAMVKFGHLFVRN
jgi:hypothetical protein